MTIYRSIAARLIPVVIATAFVGACASGPPLPQVGQADADKFLFQRGTENFNKKNWLSAREYFRRLVDGYPQSAHRFDAKLGIGDTFIGEDRIDSLILGANEFREFLSFYPLHPRTDYAQLRLGYAQFKQMLGSQRDQTATHEAIAELRKFVENYPDSKYMAEGKRLLREARDRLAESEFKVGLLYYRTRVYPGAVNRFSELLKSDPEYSRKDQVYFYFGETLAKIAATPEALAYFERLVTEYPKSEFRQKAEKRAAEIKRLRASGGDPVPKAPPPAQGR